MTGAAVTVGVGGSVADGVGVAVGVGLVRMVTKVLMLQSAADVEPVAAVVKCAGQPVA